MNWEVAGVFAEVVSAIAVVATLVYLSVQIKLSREASQVDSSYSTIEIYSNWRSHLIENEKLAEAVAKANRGETLSEGEDIQIAHLMDDLFIACAISQAGGEKSNALYDAAGEVEYIERLFNQNPGLAPYWERARGFIESNMPNFARAVNSSLADKTFPITKNQGCDARPPNKAIEADA